MKTAKKLILSALCVGTIALTSCGDGSNTKKDVKETVSTVQTGTFKPANIQEQLKYNRAIEAVIWGIPVVNYDAMYQAAMRDAKAEENQLVYWSKPSDWKNQTLTPNTDALYIMPFFNTKSVGPIVLEIPPVGTDGAIVGTIMDAWQMALEDVGKAGADEGKGGKYLILPPAYTEKVPAGYIVLQSNFYKGFALLRSMPKSSSDADIANAVTYLKRIKIYPLSAAAKQPETKFVDATNVVFDATIPYDMRFFESLDRMVQSEPWTERDRVMINTLKSIGIEKGKSFAPDATMTAMMKSALVEARELLVNDYEKGYKPFFESSRWTLPVDQQMLEAMATAYKNSDVYPIDARGTCYYYAFSSVKHMGAGQFYLFVSRDKNGEPMDGGKNYKLTVPANVPVQQYWSATAYNFETHTLIRDMAYASRSSLTPELVKNADGSVDIYFGPKAPEGKASNWIPTKAGERFEGLFRLYGPDKSFFEKKTWILPDIEEVK